MNIVERITFQDGSRDAWACICGNTPSDDGFSTCNDAGEDCEPVIGGEWDELYRCDNCGRIIDQRTLVIVGRVDLAALSNRID